MNFIVLSSSHGTTFQAILDRLADGTLTGCLGLVADREDRGCVEKARRAHLPVSIVEHAAGEERESYDRRLDAAIRKLGKVELIAAIGWMYVLSPWFVKSWRNRILNVHPSLLPRFPGAHAHEDVLAAGEKESGMTIHLIDEGVDTGPILIQKRCPVLPSDSPDTLKTRVQGLEKEWYPKVLAMIEKGTMSLPPSPQS